MGSVEEDLDLRTEQAWSDLASGLAQVMAALQPKRFFCIEAEVWHDGTLDGSIPYLQVMRLDDGVHVEASSNYYLDTQFRLRKETRAALRSLGFHKPGSKGLHNYWATFDLAHLDETADVIVRAFRDGFAVIHPAFLQTGQPDLAPLVAGATAPDPEVAQTPDEPKPTLWELADGEDMATYPDGVEHLQRLVIQALTPMLGVVPEPDEDGDIPVRADTAVAFVCVHPELPLVTIHANVVVDVQDEAAAVIEAGLLNKETAGVQFVADGAVVSARMVMPATPFVPPTLRTTLDRMLHVLPRVDKDLARRVRGRVFLPGHEPTVEGLPDGAAATNPDDLDGGTSGSGATGTPGRSSGSPRDTVGERAARRLSQVLDRMHPVLAQMVLDDLERPHHMSSAAAAKHCSDDPRVMRKVLRSSRRADAALRDSRRAAAARHDAEAEALFRHVRKSTRRIRAAVAQALEEADR